MLEFCTSVCRVARFEVVKDVVDENVVNLVERVSVVRIHEGVVVPRPSTVNGFDVGAELLANRVCNERILHSDASDTVICVVRRASEVIPRSKFYRAMVHNDVFGIVEVERVVFGACRIFSRSDAQVTDDDIALLACRKFSAVNGDTFARGGLSGDSDVRLDRNGSFDIDDAANVKNDNAVPLTDCIAE